MRLLKVESVSSGTMSKPLPQLVPSSTCFRCEVCCRFPEVDSFLRPYFTEQEASQAVALGLDARSFPGTPGGQINLVKHPTDEGYLCPAFDTATNRCGIYEVRPLDCQLYPLALMWDAAHHAVVLGWDTKCPFMRETVPPAIAAHAERMSALLDSEDMVETIAVHPGLIGRYQDDVITLKTLPRLTARLAACPTDARLHALTDTDAPRFTEALKMAGMLTPEALAAYAFPYHAVWTSVLPYWWMEIDQTFFLFAQSPDGFFMPLVPLGPRPLDRTVGEAFAWMQEWNGSSPVSRIENVMALQTPQLQQAGVRLSAKDGDYVYRADALAALAGDRYKSQRALCNRVQREHAMAMEPYHEGAQTACAALYARWAQQKREGRLDEVGRWLLEDAAAAHQRVFANAERLGLQGMVARVEGEVAAYTFGYWLTPETFCIMLEVADRGMPGLAQWVFRETCRAAADQGALYINGMDDAGLAGLRDTKRAYHPVKIIESWIAMGH
jgi:uncharacterized protein